MLKSPCRPPAPAPALIQFQNSVMASMPPEVHRAAGARGDLDGQVGAVREGAEAVAVAPGETRLVEQAAGLLRIVARPTGTATPACRSRRWSGWWQRWAGPSQRIYLYVVAG